LEVWRVINLGRGKEVVHPIDDLETGKQVDVDGHCFTIIGAIEIFLG
jgi:hypothetical protein